MSDHKKKHAHTLAHEKHEEAAVAEEAAIAEIEPVGEAVAVAPRMQGAWSVFKDTFMKWQKHWKVFTGIQIIWAAVFLGAIILGSVAAGFGFATSGIFKSGMAPEQITGALTADSGALALLIIGALIVAAILVIISTWMSLATVQAWDWVRKEEHDQMSVRRAYAATWELVPGYIWISILALALVALGFFGFAVPGILLALAFSLLPSIVVVERLKGRYAIMRATRLARPYLPRLFWRLLVAVVVLYVPGEILTVILNSLNKGLGDAVNQLYGLVVTPIVVGVLFATYLEFKAAERKQKYLVWLSLERLALLGALIMVVVLGIALLFNKA